MELTLDQALQKGVEAHKAGKAQEADRYYTAILKANPKHPDANHNMGVLAVGVGKVEDALPFFKAAVEVNPNIAQYWLSYIDALIKLDRMTDAKAVFDQAMSKGAKADDFDQIELQIKNYSVEVKNQTQEDIPTQPNILDEFKLDKALKLAKKKAKDGLSDEAKKIYQDIIKKFPKNKKALDGIKTLTSKTLANTSDIGEPPGDQFQSLLNLYTQGQHQQALNQAYQLQKQFPNSINLYNIIGAANKSLGKLDEAIEAYNKSISIKPGYAEAYYNMGVTLQEQGKLDEAIEAYNKTISIKPGYAEAYYNMGVTLQEQGMLGEAIRAYKKALSIKPGYAEAYYNMGNALKVQGKLNEAIDAYYKALSIKPDYADAHSNMGNALKAQGKLNEAIDAYYKVLSIKPDYAEAYSNMGNALKAQGKLNEAIDAYYKALSIKPDYAEAYSNMGVALKDQGKLEEAIGAYTTALSIKPDYAEVWNNLYFPLQAMKSKINSDQNLNAFYPKGINSNYGKTQLGILDYRLYRGQENEKRYLDRALTFLSNNDNTVITNPKFNSSRNDQIHSSPDRMVALVHFGRSGTGLLHSLIDGHSEISTLPSIYFSEYFNHSVWHQIISDGWSGMVERFMSIYDVLFDATSSVPIETASKKLLHRVGFMFGMANVGDEKNEALSVDRAVFGAELKRLMLSFDELDAFTFFKLVHKAYDLAINDTRQKNMIFYHIHNPDTYAQLNFTKFSKNTKWVMMVREPVQTCESWVTDVFKNNDVNNIATRISHLLKEVDNPLFVKETTIGVRLEDLKEFPTKTIPALCAWLGIEQSDSLYEMTAQGKKWWGDPASPDYEKEGMNPFGKKSIKRKVGLVFSEKDQFILRTLFYPFSVRFGYITENLEQFKADLETIRPLLDEMFDFEKSLADRTQLTPNNFMKSGSYLYLRSNLIERWNTLNVYQTYPEMIKPLKIN